jgi:prolyl-tRNA editing enzyme YbaK/EbsC (Cys-tRNA(Pro) deacylase)
MSNDLSPSAGKVQAALRVLGFANQVVEHERPTRSSAEAAAAVGCTVGEIAKSIVFRATSSDRPVLVIASGANRVDEDKISRAIGEGLEKADAAFVRERTGFVIGGVPPVGHATPPIVLVDRDLLAFGRIWAAAGTPNAVFPLTPDELLRMSGGRATDVKA